MKYLAFFAELSILVSLSETFLDSEDLQFFKLLLAATFIVIAVMVLRNFYLRPTVFFTLMMSTMLVSKIAIHSAYFWHERISDTQLGLDGTSFMLGLALLCFAVIDLCTAPARSVAFYFKGVVYACGGLLVARALYSSYSLFQWKIPLDRHELYLFTLPFVLFLPYVVRRANGQCILNTRIATTFAVFCVGCLFIAEATAIYNCNKTIFKEHGPLSQNRYPKIVVTTLLAAEDPIFFHHHGVDFSRLQEALNETIIAHKFVRGGSTLTMQLVKITTDYFDKTIWRKLVQILGAAYVELMLSKEQILDRYLENVSFGANITGIEQASLTYFHRSLMQLPAEDVLKLVITIFDPAAYNPFMKIVPHEARLRAAMIESRLKSSNRGHPDDLNQLTD